MHGLSAFLSSKLLQPDVSITCHSEGSEDERRKGIITHFNPDDLVCRVNFSNGGGTKTVNLCQLPFKIAIPEGTPIQCDKLLGHEVEVYTNDVYYAAVVNQVNTEVAANLLRFTNGDKMWIDMVTSALFCFRNLSVRCTDPPVCLQKTKKYKLVSSPAAIDFDASLSLDDQELPPDTILEVDYDPDLDAILIEQQVYVDVTKGKDGWHKGSSSLLPTKPPPLAMSGGSLASSGGLNSSGGLASSVGSETSASESGTPTKGKSPKRKKHKTKSPKKGKSPKKKDKEQREAAGADADEREKTSRNSSPSNKDKEGSTSGKVGEPHPPLRPAKLNSIGGITASKLQPMPLPPTKPAQPPTPHTPHAPVTPKEADAQKAAKEAAAKIPQPPVSAPAAAAPEAAAKSNRKISVDSYVIKNGTKTVVQRVYTLEDLEKKKEGNPKYADDWQKLISQFDERWMEQRKIAIDSYVIKDGKKTLVQRTYTKKDLEGKKRANPKYANDWQTLIDQFDSKFEEQEKKRQAEGAADA
jgi:hypothetical protein